MGLKRTQKATGSQRPAKRAKTTDEAEPDRTAIEEELLSSLGLWVDDVEDAGSELFASLPQYDGPSTLAAADMTYGDEMGEAELYDIDVLEDRAELDYEMSESDEEVERENRLKSPLMPAVEHLPRSDRSIQLQIDDLDEGPVPPVKEDHLESYAWTKVEGMTVFPCPQPGCSSRFLRVIRLNAHTRLHQAGRAYGCGVCPIAFTRLRDLKRHLLTHAHTVAPPAAFNCLTCKSTFASIGLLRRHRYDPRSRRACKDAFGATRIGDEKAEDRIVAEYRKLLEQARLPPPTRPGVAAATLPGVPTKGESALQAAHIISYLHGLISSLASANGGTLNEASASAAVIETLTKAQFGGPTALAIRAVWLDVKAVHLAAMQAARNAKAVAATNAPVPPTAPPLTGAPAIPAGAAASKPIAPTPPSNPAPFTVNSGRSG